MAPCHPDPGADRGADRRNDRRADRRNDRGADRGADGAVAVTVAVFLLFVGLAIAALAVDLGGGWATQRELVTDTDALALTGARTLAEEFSRCGTPEATAAVQASVAALATANGLGGDDLGAVGITCGPQGRWGTVRVDAARTTAGWFAAEELLVGGTTTALFTRSGPAMPGLAICANQFLPLTGTGPIEIGYRFQTAAALGEDRLCPEGWAGQGAGAQPGGWGWLALGAGDWVYAPETVCPGGWCPGHTGTNLINDKGFNPGLELLFPLFDHSRGQGAGHEFHLSGWGAARLLGCTNVSGATPGACNGARRWIVLDDVSLWRPGDDPNADPRFREVATAICGVRAGDHCPTP